MGSLDQISRARKVDAAQAKVTGGTLDQLSAQRNGKGGGQATFTPTPAKKASGGLLGGIEHGAHWVASKADLASHDIKAIPGGLVDLVSTDARIIAQQAQHPLQSLEHPLLSDTKNPSHDTSAGKHGQQLAKGTVKGTEQSLEHPLRDPFQTLMTVAPIISGGAGAAARAGEVADAVGEGASLGDLAKAAIAKPEMPPRLIKVGDAQVPLHASENPAVRAVQAVYDKALQHGIDQNPEGRAAGHAMKRVGGSLTETGRYQARMRAVPGQLLEKAAKKLAPTGGKLPGSSLNKFQRVEQAALELTSTNTTPEEAAAYHLAQAEKGVEPERNQLVAKLYQAVSKKGLLTQNDAGDVIVDADKHPVLAHADAELANVQGRGDETLAKYGVRTPEQLAERVNAPGRIRAGADYEKPTPAKAGVPSQTLLKARGRVARLEALHERATAKASEKAVPYDNVHTRTGFVKQDLKTAPEAALKRQHVEVAPGPKTPGVPSDLPARGVNTPTVERLGSALSVARDELARLEQAAAGRVKDTGIVGGETAREGRGFVSYATDEPRAPKNAVAGARGPVVGETKAPVTSKAFTGEGLAAGKVPNDITGQAARHFHQIQRFVNTTEWRNALIKTGVAARRSSRDILVKVPGEAHAALPQELEAALGKKKLTTDDVAGLSAALQALKEEMVPGLKDRFAKDRAEAIGAAPPEGHVWVDRNVLGDLAKAAPGPRGKFLRSVDNVNSAVTAATVYFKFGHIGTRVLTNATTNLIQGSAAPTEIARSLKLWDALSEEDKMRAFAASGQHGFSAMPHEGQSIVSRIAGKGANWWAKHADAPFRFNSIAYEARKAGFDTPAKFRDMLDKLENPHDHNMNAAEAAKVDWVAKRANRAGIAYDRMNAAERDYVTRALWFYNWLKGSTMFAGHTLTEHPFKAGALGAAGKIGEQRQQSELGDLPSYEYGLIPFGHGDTPKVADFSTFSPFATPGDIAEAIARPAQLSGFLNPGGTAITNLIFGRNQYGQNSTSPIKDALASLVAPTPESQVVTAYLQRHKNQSGRMFPTTPLSAIERTLAGPGMPRRVNTSALRRDARNERAGR